MPSPPWTRVVIGLTALCWLLPALLLDWDEEDLIRLLGVSSSVVLLLLLSFDRVVWRWLPERLVRMPQLRGTWQGAIEYEMPDGEITRQACFLVIDQTYSTIAPSMLFENSASVPLSAGLVKENSASWSLFWSYLSSADALHRRDNPPHRGGAQLRVPTGSRGRQLEGDYWTERLTRGRIVASAHSKRIYATFKEAESAYAPE